MEREGSERRRGRRTAAVRCALVLGFCALLVSLVALTLILTRRPDPSENQLLRGEGQECWPKRQTCARLVHNGSRIIENRTLKWDTRNNIDGVIFGQEFHYDEDSGMLKIIRAGMYCIYAQMAIKLIVTNSKEQGNATLTIHHKTIHNSDPILSLSVHLYPRLDAALSPSMAVLFPLKENDLLRVTLTASSSSGSNFFHWQLEDFPIFSVSRISGNCKSQVTENKDFCYDARKICS
ncbi:hypothetical protein lerEdw1_002199 [Lerista edwardsae]|nr:hypothetical protein lerEdw1_002199 [Lerista edwardsae]